MIIEISPETLKYSKNANHQLILTAADSSFYKRQIEFDLPKVSPDSSTSEMNITSESPIYKLQFLKDDWDERGAYAFSKETLEAAESFYKALVKLYSDHPPAIKAGSDSIRFRWKSPKGQLDIRIHGDEQPYADSTLELLDNEPEDKTAGGLNELMSLTAIGLKRVFG